MSVARPRLPRQTMPRILAIVERSQPSMNKPPLTAEREARLDATERKNAVCYAGMEEITSRFWQLARELDEDDE